MNQTIGAVVISRYDGYGGAQPEKLTYCLSSLIGALDEVIYVDWNSPNGSLFDAVKQSLPRTGKLRAITVTPQMADQFCSDPERQKCVEVLARNIGLRRLTSDYLISTNADVMCLERNSISRHLSDAETFYCVARRECKFPFVQSLGNPGSEELIREMHERRILCPQWGDGSPLGIKDRWSLITSPGDFQVAHRNVWHHICGFEESLTRRGYADSNVQRKADFYGYKLNLMRDIPVFHFEHYPDTGSCGGGVGAMNDRHLALEGFNGTGNSASWGFAEEILEGEIL